MPDVIDFEEAVAAYDAARLKAAEAPAPAWPELNPAALYGLPGDVVREIAPHSEADPAAILGQFLTAAGNALGRQAHYLVEGDRHPPNLFTVLVGESGKGRKGTSWGRVRQVMAVADATWTDQRIVSGLASGEGVIWAVRDAIVGTEKQGRGAEAQRIEVEVDPGIRDKRLMVVEPEYERALSVMRRDGNTLSAVVREAWDRGTLSSLTKNSPARATGAHVSIVGHITTDELRASLDRVSMANGSANRVLWLMVRRARVLPFGGNINPQIIQDLGERTAAALAAVANITRVDMNEEAKEIWRGVYEDLSAGRAGLLGAITNRAEAQVIRIALIYALLDGAGEIAPPHLLAALALWEYAEASAEYIWRDTVGDPLADEILRLLRSAGAAGKTRNEILNHFGRNRTADELGAALERLAGANKASRNQRPSGGMGGRPAEIWTAEERG